MGAGLFDEDSVAPEMSRGIGMCTEACPSFQLKVVKEEEDAADPVVICNAGEQAQSIEFQNFCVPWIEQLIFYRRSAETAALKFKDERDYIQRGAIRDRSAMGRLRTKDKEWSERCSKLEIKLASSAKKRAEMWDRLKAVQVFQTEKNKFDKKLAGTEKALRIATEANAGLVKRVEELETQARNLRNQVAEFEAYKKAMETAQKENEDLKKEPVDAV